ncbi:proline reductase [Clostridium botulinum]
MEEFKEIKKIVEELVIFSNEINSRYDIDEGENSS